MTAKMANGINNIQVISINPTTTMPPMWCNNQLVTHRQHAAANNPTDGGAYYILSKAYNIGSICARQFRRGGDLIYRADYDRWHDERQRNRFLFISRMYRNLISILHQLIYMLNKNIHLHANSIYVCICVNIAPLLETHRIWREMRGAEHGLDTSIIGQPLATYQHHLSATVPLIRFGRHSNLRFLLEQLSALTSLAPSLSW